MCLLHFQAFWGKTWASGCDWSLRFPWIRDGEERDEFLNKFVYFNSTHQNSSHT